MNGELMTKKLWGARFAKKTDPLAEEFTRSIQYDYKLARYDVLGTLAHVRILGKAGYLAPQESSILAKALNSIYDSIKKNEFKFNKNSEDIHTNIQNALYEKAGDLTLKLHTARSRNEQVAFAAKLYCKIEIQKLLADIQELNSSIADLAGRNKEIIIPGFTHLQHAQPVYLKNYLLAYLNMLKRDYERLADVSKNIRLTMGSGALAGTPIEAADYSLKARDYIKDKEILKVSDLNIEPVDNSLDSVSDRDFVIEAVAALSIIAMHLSRLSEDLIIWSTKEFDFIEIDEAFCTGSSLMPQKKNPDVLELIRGYSGRLYGNLVSVLVMMKGLPLAYNRDMQLDKEPLFNSFEIVSCELKIMAGLIKTLRFNKARIAEHLKDESLYATDLVYYLVHKKIPFKEAHNIIGRLVRYSLENSIGIKDIPESLLKKFSPNFVKSEIIGLFDSLASVEAKRSIKRHL